MIKSIDLEGIKSFIKIIHKQNTRKLIILTFFLFLGILFETIGLGLLYPIFNFLFNEPEYNLFGYNLNKSNVDSFWLLCVVGFIYVIKSLYLTFLAISQNKFISKLIKNLSNEIFCGYLLNDYTFHLKKNSADLVKNIQVELSNFTAYLSSVIHIITDIILSLAVVLILVYINPKATLLLLGYIFLGSLIFLYITKLKLDVWGKKRFALDKELSIALTEPLKGIKEIKISRLENFFYNKYKYLNDQKFNIYWKQVTLGQLPRVYLELISIIGFIIFIIFALKSQGSINTILPIVGVYLAAFFRTLPSINRILTSYQNLRYFLPSVKLIEKEIKESHSYHKKKKLVESFKKGIILKDISFSYQKTPVFQNLNLKFQKGKFYAIKGESGSGKSTLAAILLGLLKPKSGKIFIDSEEKSNFNWSNILSYVSQKIFLFDKSILENICLGIEKDKIDYKKLQQIIKITNLFDFINSLEDGLNHKLGENGTKLSGGQAQRLAIARALYNEPEILVLDEATSALDKENESYILKQLNLLKGKITIILISHNENLEDFADIQYDLNKLI